MKGFSFEYSIMSLDQTMMERLVFVKSLHHEGVQQSKKPMPMASAAVLTFHDAIELFLYTGAEYVDTKPESNILNSFNNIEQKIDTDLYGHAGISRLRESRVTLKHFATRPDEMEIDSFRNTVQSFFEENTPKIFGIKYSDVELYQLVQFDRGREFLERAADFWEKGKQGKAMGELAVAHDLIMTEHRERARSQLDYSPYPDFEPFIFPETDELEEVNETFREVSEAMMYISLGIDYSEYSRFKYLTPRLRINNDPDTDYGQYRPYLEEYDYTDYPEGSYEYCQKFLIDLALSLQNLELDFDTEIDRTDRYSESVFDF